MKKLFVILSGFFLSIWLVSIIHASSAIEYFGEYKNEHIVVHLSNVHAYWFYRRNNNPVAGSMKKVTVRIQAREGYQLSTQTSVIFRNQSYKVNGMNPENNIYRQGEISFHGSFLPETAITIEYVYNKPGETATERLVKKLKLTVPHSPRHSHDRIEVRLEEIQ